MHRQSVMCRVCYLADSARPENYLTRGCEKCGAPFTIHVSQAKRGAGRYCSRSCARSGSPTRKRTSPVVECFTCGRRFNKYRAEVRKNAGDRHFCSPGCWYSFNRRDNHYLWAGGQDGRMSVEGRAWRKAVMWRDKGVCRVCHSTERLEAHHINPFRSHPHERWNVENGIVLCRECHTKVSNRETEYAELLAAIARVELVIWHVEPEQAGAPAAPA